jgi:hypothetical protein
MPGRGISCRFLVQTHALPLRSTCYRPSTAAQEAAISGYIRWDNKRANRNDTSPWTPRSADPTTYPTLLDEALALQDS